MAHDQTYPADANRIGEVPAHDGSVISRLALMLRDRFGPDAGTVAERQLDAAATEGMIVVWPAILAELAHRSSPLS